MPEVGRRSAIRGLAGTGALLGLDEAFSAEPGPAAPVGPNDTIKVTKLETFVLKNSWVFVKISTDAGRQYVPRFDPDDGSVVDW